MLRRATSACLAITEATSKRCLYFVSKIFFSVLNLIVCSCCLHVARQACYTPGSHWTQKSHDRSQADLLSSCSLPYRQLHLFLELKDPLVVHLDPTTNLLCHFSLSPVRL